MDTNSAYNCLSTNQEMYTPPKQNQFSLSSLLSPPEPKRQDSFQTSPILTMSRTSSSSLNYTAPHHNITPSKQLVRPACLLSPPVSPQTMSKEQGRGDEGDSMRDPVLFPSSQDTTVATEPLFSQGVAMAVDQTDTAINHHIATGVKNGPPAEDYRLVVEALSQIRFQSNVHAAIKKVSPQVWVRDEIKWEKHYLAQGPQKNKKKLSSPSYKPLAPAPAGVQKTRVTLPRVRNQPKAKPVEQAPPFISCNYPQSTPPPSKAPRPTTTRADDPTKWVYTNWPDYCPKIPDNFGSKSLKAVWKGQPKDLSDDVFRHELHAAELILASTLRLSCAMYLTSKRQIFKACRDALKSGKEFRKTNAQEATKIDVNKASALWTAFEKVGWFNSEHFDLND
ncbi:SWIRM domain-containing protein FUN19 [Venturia nashicola]|uniref:SWIRM domain-containing protein FUN19 n=1 Tax=Venturia nashicola TaxID=86259 RepID=A0A4Z1PF24_9PEZI|nr:SWIRM domain-containing protein FUN19 [Venturia nashicola]TLD31883.1 SWIRM domain-containing protein FUN19 [Venturia nashicola]